MGRELLADDAVGPSSGSRAEPSTTWTRMRVRSTWRRNAWPRPAPWLAPSMRPGHVGDRRPPLVLVAEVEDAEVRLERRERVIGDLRAGRREGGEQRRLAGVREADEADVGDEAELEAEPALLARLAVLGVLRRLVGGGLEVGVAESAASAAGDHRLLAGRDEVGQRARRSRRRRSPSPAARSRTRSSPALPWRREPSPRPPGVALK